MCCKLPHAGLLHPCTGCIWVSWHLVKLLRHSPQCYSHAEMKASMSSPRINGQVLAADVCKALLTVTSMVVQEEPICGMEFCWSPHVHVSISIVSHWTGSNGLDALQGMVWGFVWFQGNLVVHTPRLLWSMD